LKSWLQNETLKIIANNEKLQKIGGTTDNTVLAKLLAKFSLQGVLYFVIFGKS